jgi:(aminoalkyl)phosphonate N-acetyltransferase
MLLRKANSSDCEWVCEILEELRTPVSYSLEQFSAYYLSALDDANFDFYIFCHNEDRLGLMSLNKFNMPRYLGYGYEMEEFVVHKDHRGKGISYQMIEAIKTLLEEDKLIRKLIIKSNGEDSKYIYAKALNQTDLVTFQVYLNKL